MNCKFCGKETNNPKYCSSSCAAKYNNVLYPKRIKNKKCRTCDNLIVSQNTFCPDCIFKEIYTKRVTNIKDAKTNKTIKNILINDRGYKCEICKIENWMGKSITLELHHIDGNSDNSDESNLQILCPNCHSQTDNYRAKNKNAGENSKSRYKKNLKK